MFLTYVIDRGLDGWTAAMILSLVGFFNIFRVITQWIPICKDEQKNYFKCNLSFKRSFNNLCLFLLPASNISAFLFGASFGFLWLSTVPATVGIVAHVFGTKYLGLLYGLVFLSHQIGSFFGAYLGGLFHDLYGSYDYAWYLAIALSIFAGIIHLPIKEQTVLRLETE